MRKCYNIISDQHEKCINKVLRGHQSDRDKKGFSGTEIAVTLAEHLLGKLAPGKSYVVDEKVKRKGKCRCGYEFCESDPMFGSTGIGMFSFKRIQSYFLYTCLMSIFQSCIFQLSLLIRKRRIFSITYTLNVWKPSLNSTTLTSVGDMYWYT